MRTIILLALVGLMVGCATQSEIDSWLGSHYDDLVISYGTPGSVSPLSDGRSVVEFYYSQKQGITSYTNPVLGLQVNGGGEFSCTLRFVLGQDGYVQNGAFSGNTGACNRLVHRRK
jgi:hypothetical protein